VANFSHKEPCPGCGSKDNLARYDDGSASCFGIDCDHYEAPDGSSKSSPKMDKKGRHFLRGSARAITARKLTRDTCEKFGYTVDTDSRGRAVQVAPYYDEDGKLVGQKVRSADKDFYVVGDVMTALPFGAQLWPRTGRKITVTEGEIDAMSMSQVQGNAWPTVSIACGAGGQIRKYLAHHRDYFRGFDEVVIMFDQDEAGKQAAEIAAEVIGFDKVRLATLPLKDPSEMLVSGKGKELLDAMWRAKVFSPEGIVDLAELHAEIKTRPRMGLSWFLPSLTKLTYGKRPGEVYGLGAGTGIGKTDMWTQDAMHMVREHKQKVGIFSLEQNPRETGLRLVGKFAGKALHVPDSWDETLFDKAWKENIENGRIFLYNSFGVNTWEAVRGRMEFLAHAHEVRHFYLDHLTAIAASVDRDERKALDTIMEQMATFMQKIQATCTFVSHLASPDGKPHEEGGRVEIRHFRGSRSIGFWSHFLFGLERDQQAENEEVRQTTTFRILKDRYTGRSVGQTFYLGYDFETGMLYEKEKPQEADDFGFDDEPGASPDF
jgi:twinkle protein